ncbi:MAG: nuclear transport factor 2 family protein [Janthinobacterium lividum]
MSDTDATRSANDALVALMARVDDLTRRLTVQEDIQSVRKLQFKYGYYMDKGLYDEVVDLFADDGELHFMGGIFRGRAGLRRLYCDRLRTSFTHGHNGPVYGLLADHMQLQDIVDIAADGLTAAGRFRAFMQAGSHVTKPAISDRLPLQWWEAGVYENVYVKQAGVWKIRTLDYHMVWQANYETGWAHSEPYAGHFFATTFPDDPAGPDALTDRVPGFWPEVPVVDFHYPHPVTGAPWPTGRSDGRKPG